MAPLIRHRDADCRDLTGAFEAAMLASAGALLGLVALAYFIFF